MHAPSRPRLPRLAALVLAGVLAAACGPVQVMVTEPPATPTDFPGLVGRLSRAGLVVDQNYLSGEAGCADPELVPAAIRFDVRGLDQAEPARIYLYVFRNRAAWERNRDRIGPCAQAYVTDPATFESVEESPYVVAGQGPWAPEFEAALRAVLAEAAGTGG